MAATGSLAAPQAVEVTNAIDVLLSSPDLESNSATRFVEGVRDAQLSANKFVASDTVELRVGPDVEQQNVRCQILDAQDEPILVFRDPNFDFTFADGNGGPWTLVNGAELVKTIVCDPEFVGNPLDMGIKVTLSDGNLATQTEFEHFGLLEEKSPVGSSGPFNNVALTLGADVSDQNLRCQIIDDKGDAIDAATTRPSLSPTVERMRGPSWTRPAAWSRRSFATLSSKFHRTATHSLVRCEKFIGVGMKCRVDGRDVPGIGSSSRYLQSFRGFVI